MAIPCQGFTFTWGGQTLSQVQELQVNVQRDLPLGRTTTWTPNLGDVQLFGFSITNLPTSEYGKRKQLTIKCPATTAVGASPLTLCDVDCIYQSANIAASANGAVTFAHKFKVMDTVGAPSNP